MIRATRSKSRRGVVLLLVLAILATFGITALTFFLSTGQVKDSAIQNSHTGTQTFTPGAYLEEAVMQILRGTNDSTSVIGEQSLLEDMYGPPEVAQVEYHALSFSEAGSGLQSFTGGDASYVGRVITNVEKDSASYGKSAVVIQYQNNRCYVLPQGDGSTLTSGNYLLNERPFQNERDYDAPDANNLFLAARDPATGKIKIGSYNRSGNWEVDADNDGLEDSEWLDLGMPPQAMADGRLFKPLFGIVIEDMDGRLNVNAHGDVNGLHEGSQTYSTFRSSEAYEFAGLGRGPAEISLDPLNQVSHSADVVGLIQSRMDNGQLYATHRQKGCWYGQYWLGFLELEQVEGVAPKVQGTPYDIRGVIGLTLKDSGLPSYSTIWDHAAIATSISQVREGEQEGLSPNPYDLDLGSSRISGEFTGTETQASWNHPYSPSELERILCPYEFHTPDLPDRLADYLGLDTTSEGNADVQKKLRSIITTESWDIPVIPDLDVTVEKIDETSDHFPEIYAGFPIDLLRTAMFNKANDPEDENGRYPKREAFARRLYNLLNYLKINMGGGNGQEESNAQWAINVVDFLDADSIMTPFEYQPGKFVFGCERPELLISETLALHSRNTAPDVKDEANMIGGELKRGSNPPDNDTVYENYTLDGIINEDGTPTTWDEIREENKDNEEILGFIDSIIEKIENMEDVSRPNGEIDFDQNIRPQGALYVELYHPWGNTGETEPYTSDLYNDDGHLELGKKVGDDSVWRIIVEKKSNWELDDPDENSGTGVGMDVERIINLAATTSKGGIEKDDVYVYPASDSKTLKPGGHLILGPEGITALSFQEGTEEDPTPTIARKIKLEPLSATFDSTQLATENDLEFLPIAPTQKGTETGIRLSLTETGRYDFTNNDLLSLHDNTEGSESLLYTIPIDKPLDNITEEGGDGTNSFDLMKNERHANYRVLHLQRLANPTRSYNETTNPYLTVDSMPADLMVFNARTRKKEGTLTDEDDVQFDLVSRKRGQNFRSDTTEAPALTMIWSQELSYGNTLSQVTTPPWSQIIFSAPETSATPGEFTQNLFHAFGKLGASTSQGIKPFATDESGTPIHPIPWLTWLNRPPVSPLELMNVPNCKSSMLLRRLHIPTTDTGSEGGESGGTEGGTGSETTGNCFSNTTGLQGHLPNFSTVASGGSGSSSPPKKIFGYLRVPSPQTVTPMVLNNGNLQTSAGTEDTSLPFAYYSMYREPGKINVNTIYSQQVFSGLLSRTSSDTSLWQNFLAARGSNPSEPWNVIQPFRSIGEITEQSLLQETEGKYGLFGNNTENNKNDPQYHPYLRYSQYYRLANLTTTRSNVFAVWITMGLFECNQDGTVDSNRVEIGQDTGEVKRYRAFYIIDRSIPVGFERGKNHNVDRTILLRRYLQ